MAKRTFSVTGKSERAMLLEVQARNFTLLVDEPKNLGGEDAGPTPVEYLLSALSGCINVVSHVVAKEMGLELKRLEIAVEGDLDPARFMGISMENRAGFQEIRVRQIGRASCRERV